jgi:hypothetical protein
MLPAGVGGLWHYRWPALLLLPLLLLPLLLRLLQPQFLRLRLLPTRLRWLLRLLPW